MSFEAWLRKLLRTHPDVVGYSNALKDEIVRGEPTGRKAIRIYVRTKRPLRVLKKERRLPEESFGIPVDVIEIGQPELSADPKTKVRPLIGGLSTSITKGGGTMGYLCKDGDGNWYTLSCGHVYGKKTGEPVFQPALEDGGVSPDDQIGIVTRSELSKRMDAAIARIDERAKATINQVGAPVQIGMPTDPVRIGGTPGIPKLKFQMVKKSGRTTNVTVGKVMDADTTIRFGTIDDYQLKEGVFLITERSSTYVNVVLFSEPGDSGSLVVSEDGRVALGLLFGNTRNGNGYSYAFPIFRVLHSMKVRLVDAGTEYP